MNRQHRPTFLITVLILCLGALSPVACIVLKATSS